MIKLKIKVDQNSHCRVGSCEAHLDYQLDQQLNHHIQNDHCRVGSCDADPG